MTRKSALEDVALLHTAESDIEASDAASFCLDAAGVPLASPHVALQTAGSFR